MRTLPWWSVAIAAFMASSSWHVLRAQWVTAGTVSNIGTFPSISVVDARTAWIAGGPNGVPVVYRTTDGGTSWTSVGTSGLSLEMYCVWGIDSSTAYVGNGGAAGGAGGNAQFFKTTNGGASWSLVGSTGGTAGFFNGIVFSRSVPQFGVAQSDPPNGLGQPYYLSITTDGGTTWSVSSPPGIAGAASAQNSIVVVDPTFYGFGLNAGAARVYFTSNGGTSWTIGTLGISGSFISGFAFSLNKLNGIAASNTSLPNIARTTNGGVSWSVVNIGTGVTGYCTMKWIPGTNTCYLSGQTGGFKKSTDGGATWTTMTPTISGVWHMDFVRIGNTAYGYAVTPGGAVYKVAEIVTDVAPTTTLPESYGLRQNYPNPFSATGGSSSNGTARTTINYDLRGRAFVTITVHNVLGQEVRTLLAQERDAGTYTVEWDGKNNAGMDVPSGVYLYTMRAGNFVQTKKMMLMR